MERFTPVGGLGPRTIVGEDAIIASLNDQIASLTTENRRLLTEAETAEGLLKTAYADLAQSRASAAAAYERAALTAEGIAKAATVQAGRHPLQSRSHDDWMERDYGATMASKAIRALATEAETSALAGIVKRAVDAETRACAEMLPNCAACGGSAAILARLDQRKESE